MDTGSFKSEELILSREEIRRCDQRAIERYGIPGVVLMENAGAGACRFILSILKEIKGNRVCIMAGVGNNGGDGFVVARHLFNAEVGVQVVVCGERERICGDALINLRIIEHMQIPVVYVDSKKEDIEATVHRYAKTSDLIVDALLGTGTTGPAREPIRSAIDTINELNKTVVSLDIPSGLDCNSGQAPGPVVRANCTITFAALKKGFTNPLSKVYTGQVSVVSIGIGTGLLR